MQPLRIGFAGTPAFAAAILSQLLRAGWRPVQVWSQPDRPRGRGKKTQPGPVASLALAEGLPLAQPTHLRDQADAFRAAQLDVLVVVAYGLILPQAVLDAPRLGCLNVHASLLPRWRGAAPIERAIMAGDAETGVAIMAMEAGLDTGPVYLSQRTPIHAEDTGDDLHQRLAVLGGTALLQVLADLAAETPSLHPIPQPDTGVTYAAKLQPAEALLDWTQPATLLARKIQALNSRLPAYSFLQGERVRLLRAQAAASATQAELNARPPGTLLAASAQSLQVATGAGVLHVTELQLSRGKGKPLSIAQALNGYARLLAVGQCFCEVAA